MSESVEWVDAIRTEHGGEQGLVTASCRGGFESAFPFQSGQGCWRGCYPLTPPHREFVVMPYWAWFERASSNAAVERASPTGSLTESCEQALLPAAEGDADNPSWPSSSCTHPVGMPRLERDCDG